MTTQQRLRYNEATGVGRVVSPHLELAAVLLLFAVAPWIDPWRWRRLYRRQPGFKEVARGDLGDEGIGLRGPFVQGVVPWRLVVRAKMDERTILLYQAPNLFNILPRSLFSPDEDWRRAQELVREKVGAS